MTYPVKKLPDERNKDVLLLCEGDVHGNDDVKTTAQDREDCWVIVEWRLTLDENEEPVWCAESAHSIDKATVKKLYLLQEGGK